MSQEFLRYKGRPLVRSGDTLYYGSKDRMLNKAERDGLYEALSIASIWMDRHNKKEQ